MNEQNLSLSAQINLENAARQRYMARTGKTVQLVAGGAPTPALATLCEHCGQRPGNAHHVSYTARTVHICASCAALDRKIAESVNVAFGQAIRVYPILVLPSEARRAPQVTRAVSA